MGQTTPDRERLARYLVGRLPAAESEAITERLFLNDELLSELEDVERDLLDAYAGGRLSGSERHDVDTHLLNSDAQREKLQFAFALGDPPRSRKVMDVVFWAAAATVLLGLAGGAVWMLRMSAQNERLRSELASLRKESGRIENSPAIAFLLNPVDRSALEDRLEIGSAGLIRFNLAAETTAGVKAQVRVRTASGALVLDQPGVAAQNLSGATYFSIWLPATSLPPDSYAVSVTEAGGQELNYAFRVIRR